jgi:hypothetical protein
MIKHLSLMVLLATVSWFFWNPVGWTFDWEPIVVFLGSLVLYIQQESQSSPKGEPAGEIVNAHPVDIKLFKKLQTLLPSEDVIRFLAGHDFFGSFHRQRIESLEEFRWSWNNAEHKFIDLELEKLREDLFLKTDQFYDAMAKYSSPNAAGLQAVKSDHPRITNNQDWEYWQDRYRTEGDTINEKADELVKAHQLLFEKAREKLV